MKEKRKSKSRFVFGGITTAGFVILLAILLIVSIPIWLSALWVAVLFALSFLLGFTLLGGFVATSVTVGFLALGWFCFTLVRSVWTEFRLHLKSRNGFAGSS